MPKATSKYYNKEQNRKNQKRWYDKQKNWEGVIYWVINVITQENYIGSTTNNLKKRLYQHRSHAKLGKKGLLYENMREYGPENFEIELLYECKDGEDLKLKEREYIRDFSPCLNIN